MLGSGYPTLVAHWTRSFPMPTRVTSHNVLNSDKRPAWRLDGPTQGKCVWEMHGVWGWDRAKSEGVVLRENYFAKHPVSGRKVRYSFGRLVRIESLTIVLRLIGTRTFTIHS